MARTQGSHAQTTAPRIRAAAEKLFAQHGYAAVSMRQIARDVGLQAGALYNYTPDKQALLFDLLDGHMQSLLSAWHAQEAAGAPWSDLERFSRFHVQFHLDRPDAVFIAYMELRNLTDTNFRKIEMLRQAYEAILTGILERGQAQGDFAARDAKVAARAVIAMLTGVTTWYRDSGALGRDEVEDIYWQMVRGSVSA